MSKFQVGQRVVRVERYHKGVLEEGVVYTVDGIDDGDGNIQLKEVGNKWWDEDYFDLYQEPAQKTFNPKPGDLIVTEGEGNYVCVTLEKISKTHKFIYADMFDFVGIRYSTDGAYLGWQGWPVLECILEKHPGFNVKEIIPASKTLAKVEKTYAVSITADSQEWIKQKSINPVAISQQPQDLSFQVKALELENQMLRKLLRREGVEV